MLAFPPSLYPRNWIRQWKARKHWKKQSLPLPNKLNQTLESLSRDGIAFLNWKDTGLDTCLFDKLKLESIENLKYQRDTGVLKPDTSLGKNCWHKLLGQKIIKSDGSDVFAKVALSPNFQILFGHYFGLSPWLMDYNLWFNTVDSNGALSSQLWHSDTQISASGKFLTSRRNIIKAFVYLHDVSPEHGPLYYIKKTQVGGALSNIKIKADIVEGKGARRYFNETIEKNGLASNIISSAAPEGTVVIFDASGIHRGGKPLTAERLLYKFEYGDWLWRGFPYPKLEISPLQSECLSPLQLWSINK